jgi:hypothetical protein
MKVIIDPKLKEDFINLFEQMYDDDPNEFIKNFNNLEKLKELKEKERLAVKWKREWIIEFEQRNELSRKLAHIDEEIEGYLDDIEEYKRALIALGKREYT